MINQAGKQVVLWKERHSCKDGLNWTVGVQGTSLWFAYQTKKDAIRKLNELLSGSDE